MDRKERKNKEIRWLLVTFSSPVFCSHFRRKKASMNLKTCFWKWSPKLYLFWKCQEQFSGFFQFSSLLFLETWESSYLETLNIETTDKTWEWKHEWRLASETTPKGTLARGVSFDVGLYVGRMSDFGSKVLVCLLSR